MKRIIRWGCPLLFLVLCIAVFSFLHAFTVTDETMEYIDWQAAVQIQADGAETPYEIGVYTNMPEKNGTFRFTGQLPAGLEDGYLMFETTGEDLALSLNGREIYRSSALALEGAVGIAQANVPLPENAEGELVMTCTVLDPDYAMFPPLLRFMPTDLSQTEPMAYANLYGIPAGVAAMALLLVAGLFLLGIVRGKIDWSLIPLMAATAGLMVYHISQSCGYYFLSGPLLAVFSWRGMGWLTLLALAVYLVMNRRRAFWRYLGYAAAASAGTLLLCYLVSLAGGGYLSNYIHTALAGLFQSGVYSGLLYWLTLWLAVVCALISAYWVMRSFAQQRAEAQSLALKNKLVMDGYRAIEGRMREGAALRHEYRHQLTAMDLLYRKGDYRGIGAMLEELHRQNEKQAQTQFTENFTMNAILQDAASRAARESTSFEAQVHVPAELAIPENDLCVLLMNMLDNALEACAGVEPPAARYIRFKAEMKNGFLAIRCENSYAGSLKTDGQGHLTTTKAEPESHGFGLKQMSATAEKYHSLLDISFTEKEHVFVAQTALKLPEKKSA